MNVACVFVISTVRPIRGRALGRSFGRELQEVMEVWPGTPPDYERFCKPSILPALFFPRTRLRPRSNGQPMKKRLRPDTKCLPSAPQAPAGRGTMCSSVPGVWATGAVRAFGGLSCGCRLWKRSGRLDKAAV